MGAVQQCERARSSINEPFSFRKTSFEFPEEPFSDPCKPRSQKGEPSGVERDLCSDLAELRSCRGEVPHNNDRLERRLL